MDIRALHRQGLTYAEIGRIVGREWRTDYNANDPTRHLA